MTGGLAAPEVRIEVCRPGCTGVGHGHPEVPQAEWPLATAWAWLTRPVEVEAVDEDADAQEDDAVEPEPAALPWWDARSSPSRRRAVLPLVLLGELQAGVLLRAVWEVVQSGSTPTA